MGWYVHIYFFLSGQPEIWGERWTAWCSFSVLFYITVTSQMKIGNIYKVHVPQNAKGRRAASASPPGE